MKNSKNSLVIKMISILLLITLFSCTRCVFVIENFFNDVIKSDEIFVRYIINFGGDWSHYEKVEQIDSFRIYSKDKDSNTILERTYNLLFANNKPKLENDDLTNNYIKCTSLDSPYRISVETNISSSKTNKFYGFYEKQYVKTGSKNDITLNYDANQEPSIKFKTTISSKNGFLFTSNLYNYKCDYEVLNQSKDPIDKSVNIVVMGDGFTLKSIKDYRETIDSALKYADKNSSDPSEVNRYYDKNYVFWCNNVFEKFKDNINIIRIDSISLDESIDHTVYDKKRNILDCHLEYLVTMPNYARIEQILSQTKPLDITDLKDIDVLIIYLNDAELDCLGGYAPAFVNIFFPYGNKKGQNNNSILISKGYIRAIPHELGHALAKLDDEYISNDFIYRIFNGASKIRKNSRNCDSTNQITESKFGNFFNHGYENLTNDYKLKFFEGGAYNATGVYRTSEFCLMNNPNDNRLQYNPISSYHIAGTLVTRIGSTPFDLPEDLSIPENLEWKTYPLSQFFTDFPPDKFVDPK